MMPSEIKQNITIRMLMEYYGFQINKAGYINCPFHKDNHPSLKIYESSDSWFCFSCNRGGDIIRFVQCHEKVDYSEAIKRLEQYFHLSAGGELSYTPKPKKISDEDIKDLKFKALLASKRYWTAIKEKESPIYDSSIVNYSRLYATACQKIPYIESQMDELLGQHNQ